MLTSHARWKGCDHSDKEPIENNMTVNGRGDISQNDTCALSLNSCGQRWRREEHVCLLLLVQDESAINRSSDETAASSSAYTYANHFSSSKVCTHFLFWVLWVFFTSYFPPKKLKQFTLGFFLFLRWNHFFVCVVHITMLMWLPSNPFEWSAGL